MKFLTKTTTLILFFCVMTNYAQEMVKHQWKERVLLLLTDAVQNSVFKEQVDIFKTESTNFKERKLIIYKVTPKGYIKGNKWFYTDKFHKYYKKNKSTFEIVLLGLDGNIKLRQSTLLKNKDLYDLIDAMPMRKNEIRKQ